jgi:hypothetical protein
MQTFVPEIQAALLTVAIAFLVKFGIELLKLGAQYVQAHVSAEKYAQIKTLAGVIVRALDQAPQYASYDGADKKQYALMYLIASAEKAGLKIIEDAAAGAAEKVGLTISRQDLDAMIEAAVKDMNAGAKEFAGVA